MGSDSDSETGSDDDDDKISNEDIHGVENNSTVQGMVGRGISETCPQGPPQINCGQSIYWSNKESRCLFDFLENRYEENWYELECLKRNSNTRETKGELFKTAHEHLVKCGWTRSQRAVEGKIMRTLEERSRTKKKAAKRRC